MVPFLLEADWWHRISRDGNKSFQRPWPHWLSIDPSSKCNLSNMINPKIESFCVVSSRTFKGFFEHEEILHWMLIRHWLHVRHLFSYSILCTIKIVLHTCVLILLIILFVMPTNKQGKKSWGIHIVYVQSDVTNQVGRSKFISNTILYYSLRP